MHRTLKTAVITLPLLFCAATVTPMWYAWWVHYDDIRWSPDGKSIAFHAIHVNEGAGEYDISVFVADPQTGRVRNATPRPTSIMLSPHKRHLLFSDFYGVYVLPLDDEGRPRGGPIQLNHAPVETPRKLGFAPDGSRVYFGLFDYATAQISQHFEADLGGRGEADSAGGIAVRECEAPTSLHAPGHASGRRKNWKLGQFTIPGRRQAGDILLRHPKSGRTTTLLTGVRIMQWFPSPSGDKVVTVVTGGKKKSTAYVLDVSKGVANKLGRMLPREIAWLSDRYAIGLGSGLFRLDVERATLEEIDLATVPDWAPPPGSFPWTIQLKATTSQDSAAAFAASLPEIGLTCWIERHHDQERAQDYFRVRVGKFSSRGAATRSLRKLKKEFGLEGWVAKADHMSRSPAAETFGRVEAPDGQRAAFVRRECRGGYCASSMWLISPDGNQERLILGKLGNF